jgi:hypothetical protein
LCKARLEGKTRVYVPSFLIFLSSLQPGFCLGALPPRGPPGEEIAVASTSIQRPGSSAVDVTLPQDEEIFRDRGELFTRNQWTAQVEVGLQGARALGEADIESRLELLGAEEVGLLRATLDEAIFVLRARLIFAPPHLRPVRLANGETLICLLTAYTQASIRACNVFIQS